MNLTEDTRTVVRQPLPAVAQTALQQRATRVLVRAGPQIRYRLARVGAAGLTGVAALCAAGIAAIAMLLPAHQSVLALRAELLKAGHAVPVAAQPELSPQQFAASLPTREQIPALLGVVLVQATEAGVVLDQGKYTFTPAAANHLARYSFDFPVKADYGNIRTFIDKALTAIPALGLDKLRLERKNVGDTLVTAEVGFVIYLRGA